MTLVDQLHMLPAWIFRLAWAVVIVVVSYLIGQFIAHTVCQRLSAWASRTGWKWEGAIVKELRRGIPLWSLLIGLYLAVDFWQPSEPLLTTFHRAAFVLIWLSVTFLTARVVGQLIVLYGSQFQTAMPVTSLTENIVRILVTVFGLLMILNGLGISITPLLTALGVGGLAVALAIQDTLSNIFSGFYLTVSRHVRIGDYIKLEDGQEGYVEDIGWRATTIRMLPNNMVIVPNNKLSQAIITNYDLPNQELAVLVEVGIDYGSDLSHVEQVTVDVAREVMRTVPGGVPDCEPLVRYHTFGEFSVKFTVVLRAKTFVDQYLLKHEFIKRLHVRYQQEQITIPFPTQIVQAAQSRSE